jgi:hypothetical protein
VSKANRGKALPHLLGEVLETIGGIPTESARDGTE